MRYDAVTPAVVRGIHDGRGVDVDGLTVRRIDAVEQMGTASYSQSLRFRYMVSVALLEIDGHECVIHKHGCAAHSLSYTLQFITDIFRGRWRLLPTGIFRVEEESDFAMLLGFLKV